MNHDFFWQPGFWQAGFWQDGFWYGPPPPVAGYGGLPSLERTRRRRQRDDELLWLLPAYPILKKDE